MKFKFERNTILVISVILFGLFFSINAHNTKNDDDLFTSLCRMKNLVTTHEEITNYLNQIISYQINLLNLSKK